MSISSHLRRSSPFGVGLLLAVSAATFPLRAFADPPAASVAVPLEVPSNLATTPFNVSRTLNVPPNFRISVLARVSSARFMAVAPNGDILVSQPGSSRVKLVRQNGAQVSVTDFITGLRSPHDIVFHTIGSETFVYIAESHQVIRAPYISGDTTARATQVVVANLPDSSHPELQGAYGHGLKNIALDRSHNLYVSIASATNAWFTDAVSDPVRCAIYRYPYQAEQLPAAPYGPGSLFARGLRNAEGLAFVPGTDDLWAVVNNRDNIPFPFVADFDGDGQSDYGRVIQAYVDNHPPEEFLLVREGANYGWPFANPNPDTPNGLDNMPFDPDYTNNRGWSVYPESTFTRVDKGIQAHSAPLGLSFLQDTSLPEVYRNGAVVALRGSWNRTLKTGYKIIYFPWNSTTGKPGTQMDLVTGWLNDATQEAWGRPVDVVPDLAGNLLISDATAGAIYKLSYEPPPPPPPPVEEKLAVQSLALVDADLGLDVAGYEAMRGGTLTIDPAKLPARYGLRADTTGDVRSVLFAYNGNGFYRTESYTPYCIGGDTGQICSPWRDGMRVGNHVVTVTPYSAPGAAGEAGKPLTVTLNVVEAAVNGSISSFALFDVRTGLAVPGYEAITAAQLSIPRSALPSRYSLRANVSGQVGSVHFAYNIWPTFQVEQGAPFCIRRENNVPNGACSTWWEGMKFGTHTVTATPYAERGAAGLAGTPRRLVFEIR